MVLSVARALLSEEMGDLRSSAGTAHSCESSPSGWVIWFSNLLARKH